MEDRKKFLNQPTPIIQKYKENPNRQGTFDLVSQEDHLNIKYFILSIPRNNRFKDQGASLMCEAWSIGNKTLFTGLRHLIGSKNVLFGDHLVTDQKKSFFCLIQSGSTIEIHYFKGFCPKTFKEQTRFLYWHFRDQLIEAR